MATKSVSKSWSWRLASPRAQLWPILSDTERLNEALGLPRYRLRETIDGEGQRRRYGEYDLEDLRVRWEELPMEWAAPHWWRWEREYEEGPFEIGSATLVLEPVAGGGTTATYTLEVLPRGFAGRMLLMSGHLTNAARNLERIVKLADAHCQRPLGDFFSNLAAMREKRSKAKRGQTQEQDRFSDLRAWAAVAPSVDLLELRPRMLARALGRRHGEALGLCHAALEAGLLSARYRITCPTCRRIAREEETPAGLPDTFGCRHCAAPIVRDFDENIEILFRADRRLRGLPEGAHCASAPARDMMVISQQTLDPRERRELEIGLAPGAYRARVIDGPLGEVAQFDAPGGMLMQAGDDWVQATPQPENIAVENHGDKRHTMLVEQLGMAPTATSLAEAMTVACWFGHFSTRTLGLQGSAPAGEAAVLCVIDDAPQRGRVVADAVARCDGALAESDGVVSLLIFARPEQARAAAELLLSGLPMASVGGAFGKITLEANTPAPLLRGPAVEAAQINAQSGRQGEFVASEALAGAPLDLMSMEPGRSRA